MYLFSYRLICKRCESLRSNPITKQAMKGSMTTRIGCECDVSSLEVIDVCMVEEMQRGSCLDISCSSMCRDKFKATSIDHSACIPCENKDGNLTEGGRITYDDITGDCSCNNPPPGNEESRSIINYKLIEIYNQDTGLPMSKRCMRCPDGSAVISNHLLTDGQEKYMAAGASFFPNEYICVHCPDPNMYFDTDYQCKCKNGYFIVGESSIAPQKCIKYTPTLTSSDYSKVKFRSIGRGEDLEEIFQLTLNSVIFSHYYLEAASSCEYMTEKELGRSLQGCQILANLCVMTQYDDTSVPCQQFQSIIAEKRSATYRNQNDWKEGMPWLYYDGEVDDIVEDRSIQMTMSLKEREGSVTNMKYRLVKYSMDGALVAIEDLSNQFDFCTNKNSFNSLVNSDPDFTRFGRSVRYDLSCNLGSLLDKEMHFYEMYLLDESCKSSGADSAKNDCLFPIPVLNRNLLKGGDTMPNRNNDLAGEVDDIYTRRFFLFDNLVRLMGWCF